MTAINLAFTDDEGFIVADEMLSAGDDRRPTTKAHVLPHIGCLVAHSGHVVIVAPVLEDLLHQLPPGSRVDGCVDMIRSSALYHCKQLGLPARATFYVLGLDARETVVGYRLSSHNNFQPERLRRGRAYFAPGLWALTPDGTAAAHDALPASLAASTVDTTPDTLDAPPPNMGGLRQLLFDALPIQRRENPNTISDAVHVFRLTRLGVSVYREPFPGPA